MGLTRRLREFLDALGALILILVFIGFSIGLPLYLWPRYNIYKSDLYEEAAIKRAEKAAEKNKVDVMQLPKYNESIREFKE